MLNLQSLLSLFLFAVLFQMGAYSQTTYQSEATIVSDYSDSANVVQTLELTLTFSDINELGGVAISLYRFVDDSFARELSFSTAEIVSNGYLNGSIVKIPLLTYSSGENFRININPYNTNGLYLEFNDLITNF